MSRKLAGDDGEVSEPGRSPAEVVLKASEGLIRGLHHSLNNRMAALAGVAQLLESDLPTGHPLAGTLSAELRRLEAAVALLYVLGPGRGEAEPVEVGSILDQARAVCELHTDLRDFRLEIERDPTLLPLWVERSRLVQALLVVIHGLAGLTGGESGTIRIHCSNEPPMVAFRIEAEGAAEDPPTDAAPIRPESVAAASLLRPFGGEVGESPSGVRPRTEIRLPTLAEARRREAEGS